MEELEQEAKERQKKAANKTNKELGREYNKTLNQKLDEAEKGQTDTKLAKTFDTNRQYVSDAKKMMDTKGNWKSCQQITKMGL